MRKPTFLLKPSAYKAGKLYSILPDDGGADFTFTLGGATGTRVNKDGYIESSVATQPRIDYLHRPGLLLEPSRTNDFTNSEVVTTNFTLSNVTVTDNDTIAPDGEKTADKVLDNSDTTAGYINKTVTGLDGTAYNSVSFFVKFGDVADSKYEITTGATTETALITIDNSGATAVETDANSIITDLGSDIYPNGWIRFWCIVDMNDVNTTIDLKIYPSTDDVDKAGYIWVWGFQMEEGAGITSYIPCAGTATTRGYSRGDVTSMITAGVFSSGTTGSLYMEITYPKSEPVSSNSSSIIYGGTDRVGIRPEGSGYGWGSATAKSTDGVVTYHDFTRAYNKVVFNLFGDKVDVWVNGSLSQPGGYIDRDTFIDTNTLTLIGLNAPIKIHEMAGWESTLTDEESQRITG